MRTFQKAIRRAGIPVCFSNGFSPHPLMSFASPLGVGLTSEGEYLDIVVENVVSSDDVVKRLNAVMPHGLTIVSCGQLPEGSKTAMSLVGGADYVMSYHEGYQPESYDELDKALVDFLKQEKIFLNYKTVVRIL